MFRVTLREIRESLEYTEKEAANYLGITIDTLKEFEINSALMPIYTIRKMRELYKVPLCLIFIGLESDCAKYKNAPITGQDIISGSKEGQKRKERVSSY